MRPSVSTVRHDLTPGMSICLRWGVLDMCGVHAHTHALTSGMLSEKVALILKVVKCCVLLEKSTVIPLVFEV